MHTSFGPWTTAINTGGPQLDTFWKRRLAMLPSLRGKAARISRRALVLLVVFALGALAWPMLDRANRRTLGPAGALAGDPDLPGGETRLAQADAARDPAEAPRKAAPPVEFLPRPSPTEVIILAKLELPTETNFVETPLEDCINFLKDYHQINIWIDRGAIADEGGISLDAPTTLHLAGVSFESALKLILDPVELTYLVEDEVMKITTKTRASKKMITRTYPVRDLFTGRRRGEGNEVGARPRSDPFGVGSGQPAEITKDAAGNKAANAAKPGGRTRPPAITRHDDLVEAIVDGIEPDTWRDEGGAGDIVYVKDTGCLVVRQSWATHRKILQLLRDLRGAGALPAGSSARTGDAPRTAPDAGGGRPSRPETKDGSPTRDADDDEVPPRRGTTKNGDTDRAG